MPNINSAFREEVLSDIGFRPAEISDLLYPNLGKSARRKKAKAISERLKK